MTQANQQNNSFDPASLPAKRKRGRPRKDDFPGSEPGRRTQRRRPNPISSSGNGLVGQTVSGVLDGTFDAGFLLTVRVDNNGPLFRGMVFDSRLSVPISSGNDVAPRLSMSKREGISLPVAEALTQVIAVEPLSRKEAAIATTVTNHVNETVSSRLHQPAPPLYAKKVMLNAATIKSDLGSEGSETIFKGAAAAGSAKAAPQALHQPSQCEARNALNVISGEPPAVSKEVPPETTQVSPQQAVKAVDTAEGNTDPHIRKEGSLPGNGSRTDHTADVPKGNETVGRMQPDSTTIPQRSLQPEILKPEPIELSDDEQLNPNTQAASSEASTSQANPEILQVTKTSPLDNYSCQVPSSGDA